MNEEILDNTDSKENKIHEFMGEPLNNKAVWGPVKMLLHGINGSGKSWFGCKGPPCPVLIDLEGNAGNIQSLELHKKRLHTYDDTIEYLKRLLENEHSARTVVLDSLDVLVDLYLDKIRNSCKTETELKNIMAYGTEYKLCMGELVKVRKLLDDLHTKRKMHIIILAQSKLKTVNDPVVEAYTRWEPKVHDGCAAIFMDWVSCVFYARKGGYKGVNFKDDEQAAKGATTKFPLKGRKMPYNRSDDQNYLYTSGNAAHLAKNTFNLPSEVLMDWKTVTDLMRENFNNGF